MRERVRTGGAGGVSSTSRFSATRRTSRASPAALRKAFSWLAIGLALSNVLGPVVAGFMIDGAGFRAAFLAAKARWPRCRAAGWRCEARRITWPCSLGAARRPARCLGLVARTRACAGSYPIVTCLSSSCWDVHAFLVPVLGHERGFAASVIGSILRRFGIAAGAVRLLTPLVAAHLREWAILVGAMAATAILFGIYPLTHAPLAMAACSVLLGFTLGSVQPMVMSLLHQLAPEHRYGEAVAMRVIVINASSVSIPMVSGVAGSLVGAAGVFWAAGLMVGAGVRLALGLRPSRR